MLRIVLIVLSIATPIHAKDATRWKWVAIDVGKPKLTTLEGASDRQLTLTDKTGLPSNDVRVIAELCDGTVAIGTTHGISFFKGGVVTTFTGPKILDDRDKQDPRESSFIRGEIRSILEDKEGNLWVATADGVCKRRGKDWELVVPSRDNRFFLMTAGFADFRVLFQTMSGEIIAGTGQAGVLRLNSKDKSIDVLYHSEDRKYWVTGIAEDKTGTIWISVFGLGVLQYAKGKFELMTDREPWIPDLKIRSICVADDGAVWVGTHRGIGVRRADGRSVTYTADDTLMADTVYRLQPNGAGDIWVHTELGYCICRGGKWIYPDLRTTYSSYVPIVQTQQKDLWIGGWEGTRRNPAYKISDTKPLSTDRRP